QVARPSNSKFFAPFRWFETAPGKRVAQAGKPPVIHCPRILLWTRVDKSTARRKVSRAKSAGDLAPLCQQPQPQRVELDETVRVGLVVGPGVVFERDVRLGVERVRRLAPDHAR